MYEDNAIARIAAELRSLATGAAPGTQLPPVRELVARHRASPTTVQRALRKLVADGLLVTRPGHGTFVAPPKAAPTDADRDWQSVALGRRIASSEGLDLQLAPAEAGTISLRSGFLDEALQPRSLLAAASTRAARRPGAWSRVPVEGLPELRALFAAELGGGIGAHEVLVTPGGQAALSAAFRALARPGDRILVESPTYVGALAAARTAGLELIGVPTDADGIVPELLADALRTWGARLVYCQPRYANPTGAVLAPGRRAAVLEAVAAAGAFLVEDDWVHGLDLDGPSPPPLVTTDPAGHVVYIRSLTKPVAPGLRVAALVARGPVLARLRGVRMIEDFFVAPVLQQVAVEVLSAPGWPRHLRQLTTELRARRDAMVGHIRDQLPSVEITSVPRGGVHLWLRLPPTLNDIRLAAAAEANGVLVSPGSHWFPADPPGPYLRLSYASADAATIASGIATLGRLVGAGADG